MKITSAMYWGIGFILAGIALIVLLLIFRFTFILIYSIPLIVIGILLIIFRKREEKIEEVKE